MPPKTRASASAASAALKPVKERVTPGIASESTVKGVFCPKKAASTAAPLLLKTECAEGYSGWAGVGISGVHEVSTSVARFPSVSARLIAVTGRQEWK